MGLPQVFGASVANKDPVELKPLNERDVIPIRRNDITNLNVVSSSYIARTGNIPAFVNPDGQNYYINWQPPDSFTKAVNTAAEATVRDLQADRDVQKLLQKPSWTKQDRELWEQKEAMYAAQERTKVGLGDYRTIPGVPELKDRKDIQQDAINIKNLNDLSKDLDGHTKKYRNDCGVMAAVDAVVLDRAEQMLPKTAATGDYKRASAYYYTDGGVSGQNFGMNDKIGGHAFLISSATGNVIEATATAPGSHAYNKASNGNSLEQYVKGRPIITENGTVYGAWSNINDHNFARQVAAVERTQAHDDGKIFNRAELMNRDKTPGASVTESPGNGFLMVTTKGTEKGQDKYEVKVFERQNVGGSQEGYVLVGYADKQQAPGSPPPKMSVSFKEQDGPFKGSYRFDAEFGDKGVKSDILKQNGVSGRGSAPKFDVMTENQADYAKTQPPKPVPNPAPKGPVHKEESATGPIQPNPDDVKAIQTELKGRGMYKGALDGKWTPELNHGLNQYLYEAQQRGKDNGTYNYTVDQLYGTRTQASMEAAMRAKDPTAPSSATLRALNNMRDSGALQTVYRKEDLHIPGPVTVTAESAKVQPVPVQGGGTPKEKTGAPEQFRQPTVGGQGQTQQLQLPPGAVDLTGLTRSDRRGAADPVTLYDWQGNKSTVKLDPQALSGVVQVARDPHIQGNVLLTVSDRAGKNATAYSMSWQDAARSLGGYGNVAAPALEQVWDVNRQVGRERVQAQNGGVGWLTPPPQNYKPGPGNFQQPGPGGLLPGSVDLTGMMMEKKNGAGYPVTLYDQQGRGTKAVLDPQALSGVVQVSRDPINKGNVLLTVSDRAGQNSAVYSMSPTDAGHSLAGYGNAATPAFAQVRALNDEILGEGYSPTRSTGYHVPPAYTPPTPAPNWDGRFQDVRYNDRPPPERVRDFPNAPQMGAAFSMESRGVGPYAVLMAQRDAMIMARREAMIMNGGGFERERGVSVNIGIRLGR